MTFFACDFLVFAYEVELRLVVFKADFFPAVDVVARGTVIAELAAVLVLVAGDAILF